MSGGKRQPSQEANPAGHGPARRWRTAPVTATVLSLLPWLGIPHPGHGQPVVIPSQAPIPSRPAADGEPGGSRNVLVVVREGEGPALKLAAADLAHYLGRMIGRLVPVSATLPDLEAGGQVFLLATPVSRTDLPESLSRHLSPEALGPLGADGCRAVCESPVLLLAGNTDRGAANAVWAYLERLCHVGFFWSGDRIRRVDRLPFEGVSFKQAPYFAERYMSPPGGYSLAEHMDWPDWKREIDWRVHKRQNMFFGPDGALVWKEVFAELGGGKYEPTDAEQQQDDLNRRNASYARERGLRLVMPGFLGDVPAAFVAAHPEVRYVGGTRWGEVPMNKHIYPSASAFQDLSVRYIRAYTARYGPADFYFVPPYPEASPGENPDEKSRIKLDFAAAVQRVIRDVCPQAVWLADSWAFLTSEFWPPEEVQAFCDAIAGGESFRIYDTWGDERPMWTLHNGFWGKKWALGILHCFGGNTSLRGDLHTLVRNVRQVATDPRAANCVGIYLVPEVEHHNDLFFDLAMGLAWDPFSVEVKGSRAELAGFLSDYALRRYGAESADRMMKVLALLSQTVYASNDMTQPLFLHQLYTVFDFPNASTYVPPEQVARLPMLRGALEMALEEARRQGENPLYERDLVDLARRYLGDLFNAVVPEVVYAWRAGERQKFERAAAEVQAVLSCIEDVLRSSPQYRLATRIAKTADRSDLENVMKQTRNVMSIWEGSANLDYARRDDLAELIQGYYRPRIEAWLSRLTTVSAAAWSQADDDWLTKKYWDIGKRWVDTGAVDIPPVTASAPEMIQRALGATRAMEHGRPQVAEGTANLDFSRGFEGWSLSSRRMDVSLQSAQAAAGARTLSFRTWPKSGGGNLYLFQTVRATSAEISLNFLLEAVGDSSFAGLRVEGYDPAFRRVVECTYQWGDARNHWPDRYRPDNVTPEWAVGATGFLWWWVGHYAIKQRLGQVTGQWQHLEARPAEDLDRVHGAGTWRRLDVCTLRIALIASTRQPKDALAGSFGDLRIRFSSEAEATSAPTSSATLP